MDTPVITLMDTPVSITLNSNNWNDLLLGLESTIEYIKRKIDDKDTRPQTVGVWAHHGEYIDPNGKYVGMLTINSCWADAPIGVDLNSRL